MVGLSRVKLGLGTGTAGVFGWLGCQRGALAAQLSSVYLPYTYSSPSKPWLLWTNLSTDVLIALSCSLLFGSLFWLALGLRRVEGMKRYLWIFASLGLFILACGAIHAMDATRIWVPVYPLSLAFKVFCAAISIPTAIYFARMTPRLKTDLGGYLQTLDATERQTNSELTAFSETDLLVEVVTDYAIFLLDPGGLISTWNAGAERIKGFTAQEVTGKHLSIFYPEEDVNQGLPERDLQTATRDGRFEGEGWRVRKDGSMFWAHVVITALRRQNGSLVGFTKVTQDLTERRATEQKWHESNEWIAHVATELANANLHLNDILNASTFVSIIATDSQGVITTFNRGAELMLGYTSEEVVGKHTPVLFHAAEEMEKRGQILTRQLQRPVTGFDIFRSSIGNADFAQAEWTYVHKDQHPLIVNESFSAIIGKGGETVGYLGVAQDVTERHRAARELVDAYAHVKSVLESTSDGVVTISRDWSMLYANRRAQESLPDWVIGKNYWEAFPSMLQSPTGDLLRKCMEQRTEIRYELYFEPYKVWFRARAFPVEEGISIFFTDISDEKEMQEQLEHEQVLREKRIEALSHMAGGLAHEISNPLAIIHGRAADLRDLSDMAQTVASVEVQKACDNILKTTSRATNILRGLRGFAREARHDPMEWASIKDIVDGCLELQEARFERHDVKMRLDVPPDIPLLLCRETQIGQIVTNLLNNAFDAIVQAHSVERWISLSVKAVGAGLQIAVTDSGPGIEDHLKKHLMEPFFTTKEVGLGMGVGLSLSRAIAQDHGGSLVLCSDSPRTRFELYLPIDAGDAITERGAAAA